MLTLIAMSHVRNDSIVRPICGRRLASTFRKAGLVAQVAVGRLFQCLAVFGGVAAAPDERGSTGPAVPPGRRVAGAKLTSYQRMQAADCGEQDAGPGPLRARSSRRPGAQRRRRSATAAAWSSAARAVKGERLDLGR